MDSQRAGRLDLPRDRQTSRRGNGGAGNASKLDGECPFAAFNTGLFTENNEPIFGFMEQNEQPDRQPWVLRAWVSASDFRMRPFGNAMPEAASYFESPADLLYDRRLRLNPRLDHIVDDNVDRYPTLLRANKQLQLNTLAGAINGATTRVQQNYKTAVPHWYWPTPTSGGHLQLLLPLRLVSEQPELALVVDRENSSTSRTRCYRSIRRTSGLGSMPGRMPTGITGARHHDR